MNSKITELHQCAGTEVKVITHYEDDNILSTVVKLNLEVSIDNHALEDFLEELSNVICSYEE
jgi:hypothetical protein